MKLAAIIIEVPKNRIAFFFIQIHTHKVYKIYTYKFNSLCGRKKNIPFPMDVLLHTEL